MENLSHISAVNSVASYRDPHDLNPYALLCAVLGSGSMTRPNSVTEQTPLLHGEDEQRSDVQTQAQIYNTSPWLPSAKCQAWVDRVFCSQFDKIQVEKRILFAGFLITLSFSFTQVP
jgi:hypothetical protein